MPRVSRSIWRTSRAVPFSGFDIVMATDVNQVFVNQIVEFVILHMVAACQMPPPASANQMADIFCAIGLTPVDQPLDIIQIPLVSGYLAGSAGFSWTGYLPLDKSMRIIAYAHCDTVEVVRVSWCTSSLKGGVIVGNAV